MPLLYNMKALELSAVKEKPKIKSTTLKVTFV